jgi:hypothetical protein
MSTFLPATTARERNARRDNIPEISPQVDDLPRTQAHQHTHGAQRKPLDSLIRALIRIPQLLFAHPQIFHLLNNLIDRSFDAAQFRLDRLQLLASLDGRPVLRIRTDIDIQFYMTCGRTPGDYYFRPLANPSVPFSLALCPHQKKRSQQTYLAQ